MRDLPRATCRPDDGQALAEFALVIPVFLMLLFGLLDVGRAVYANSVLSQAAREGARLGAAEASWVGVPDPGCVSHAGAITSTNPGAHVCPATATDLKTHITDAATGMAVSVGPIDVHVSCNGGTAYDPAPTGDWTDGLGGDGNACTLAGSTGDVVSVRTVHTHRLITPIISSWMGPLTLSGSASMTIN